MSALRFLLWGAGLAVGVTAFVGLELLLVAAVLRTFQFPLKRELFEPLAVLLVFTHLAYLLYKGEDE